MIFKFSNKLLKIGIIARPLRTKLSPTGTSADVQTNIYFECGKERMPDFTTYYLGIYRFVIALRVLVKNNLSTKMLDGLGVSYERSLSAAMEWKKPSKPVKLPSNVLRFQKRRKSKRFF